MQTKKGLTHITLGRLCACLSVLMLILGLIRLSKGYEIPAGFYKGKNPHPLFFLKNKGVLIRSGWQSIYGKAP